MLELYKCAFILAKISDLEVMQNGVSWYFRDDDETYKTFYRYIQASAYV